MDSHSRSASPREPSRPQHRPPSPPSPAGFDNRAYQHDEADPNHNDSFTSNLPQNGHKPNGDTKTLEAVNLELINLTPKNGSKKKDVEVDMNATNPYDEYFVPVNEHRKYMRGEKLYVTADKRGEKAGCKRPLCWTLLGLVVAAIVALIVLAATGILFSNSPTPLEQYNASVSSARAFGGIGSEHDVTHDHNHDHSHHHHEQTTGANDPSSKAQENEAHETLSDETDINMYVPRTVEGELRIDNEEFVPALQDPESEEYREFTSIFNNALKRAIFDKNDLDTSANEIILEVVQIRNGSVIVTYRVHWMPKHNSEPNEELLTANTLRSNLDNYLDRNNRMISVYHVAEESVNTRPVLDMCKVNNNDCEYGCEFDETTLEFTCTCPAGQIIDMHSPKKCINILETTQPRSGGSQESNTNNFDPAATSIEPISDKNKPTTKSDYIINNNKFDWKETNYDPTSTTTESEHELNFSHIFGHESEQNESESESAVMANAEPSAESEPTAEPNLSVEPADAPSLQPELNAEPEPIAEPNPAPEPTAEPNAKPEPDPERNPEPEPTFEPNAEPEPKAHPEYTFEPKTEPEPTAEPQLEPEAKIEPQPEPEPTAEPEPEPEPSSYPQPEPKPTAEPQPEPEPTAHPQLESEPTAEPQPEPEPTAHPQLESEPTVHPQPEPEPTAEPQPEPEPNQEHNMEFEINPDSVSNSEINLPLTTTTPRPLPTAEPSSIPESSLNSHSNLSHEIDIDSHEESQSKMDITTEVNQPMISIHENIFESEPRTNLRGTEIESELSSTDNKSIIESTTDLVTESIFKNDGDIHIDVETDNKTEITPIRENENKEIKDMEKSLLVKSSDSSSEDNKFKNNENNQSPAVPVETTTDRVTISNLNNINEPSYEANPEIFTIFKHKQDYTTVSSSYDETTTEGDWLQNDNVDSPLLFTNKPMSNLDTETYDKIVYNKLPTTERSSKSLSDFQTETTTKTHNNEENDDITFDLIHKTKIESLSDMESSPITTEESPIISMANDEKLNEQSGENIKVISLNADTQKQQLQTTTIKSGIDVYSINNDYKIEDENRNFMDALGKPQKTSTEKVHDEIMTNGNEEISFDAINSLYNRSSKSIENEKNDYLKTTTSKIITSEVTEATTESDWLSESVTEINYEDVMRKFENHETTEFTTTDKVDETISKNLNKDDFEPDYLNNMGSNNSKMSDQDEPLYGIVHDYDNEDPRVKRVNPEQKTENISTQNSTEKNLPEITTPKLDSKQTETSTISDYIYKTAQKTMNEMVPATISNDHSTLVTINPAPLWEEHENDVRKGIIIKEIANETAINYTNSPNIDTPTSTSSSILGENTSQVNNLGVTIYEVSSQGVNQTTTAPKTINSPTNEYEDHETEMNPFLPEVENNKVLVRKLQEGHDLEPTSLNETQNESGDEHNLTNTDTKINTMQTSTNDAIIETTQPNIFLSQPTSETDKPLTETDQLLNDLLMHPNTHVETSTTKLDSITPIDSFDGTTKKVDYEVVPISTFLLDTDDLDDTRTLTTTTLPGNSLNNESPTEYLSVVPILEKESVKKNYKSENLQELNSINDSSKKSDRRTLDIQTNADSLINNEA